VNVTEPTGRRECRLGVLAFGDSITNGGGELQWGVALQSWALWVARALGLPFTSYAFDGARACDVVDKQIPAFERDDRNRDGRYELGCLYIGVNDVRALDWDAAEFERDFATALGHLARRADRTITLTAPLDLGRPRAGAKVNELNAVIERVTI
jgi:GDSL-like Lipase/Acylhydrolase family